jgi:hypothetical protein
MDRLTISRPPLDPHSPPPGSALFCTAPDGPSCSGATIQFLNHACIKIITDKVSVVSDPWWSGSIFNNGWSLIWTSEQLFQLASDSDFVWISHEQPDHFSPPFFWRLDDEKPIVLFQATRDRRVARYLTNRGFTVLELQNHGYCQLSSVDRLTVGKNGLYDSWSLFESAQQKILNLNDCVIKTDGDLRAVKKHVGHIDVLLTQFSYAGWVGDRSKKRLRERAAKRRLEVVRRQIQYLEPDFVIPFASFAWFCHEENAYLNDSVNRIEDVLDVCAGLESVPIVMQPMETWRIGEAHDNTPAIRFWENAYNAISTLQPQRLQSSIEVSCLRSGCTEYQRRVFARNSPAWMKILASVPVLRLFRPVHIRLADIGTTVRFSFFDDLREVGQAPSHDIEMSSESLAFIFAHDYGWDTLMVNARFRATKRGLDLVMRNFAIGNLNGIGWSIGLPIVWRLFSDANLVWLVLRELKNINPE